MHPQRIPIESARLAFDGHGAPYSERYGDVYSSRDGAEGQARHVFLAGNGLPQRWRGRDQFVILETGFGLGINFLVTWRAWIDDPQRPARLHFVSVERHPLPAQDLRRLSTPELGPLANRLAQRWPLPLPGLHRLEFERGRIVLTLGFGDARDLMPQLLVGVDAIYLDGFAPDRNPEMWDPALLRSIGRCARDGATLATWSTARPVQTALAESGFDTALERGFGSKRQMLTARFAPRWAARRYRPPMPRSGPRSALVIGAGIAGCACAQALARRGWSVALMDRTRAPAAGTSSLPWGVVHPHFAADDNLLARLTRAGTLMTHATLDRLDPTGKTSMPWARSGVFEVAADEVESQRWSEALRALGWPTSWAEWIDADVARDRLAIRPRAGGLWWGAGALVSLPSLCRALVDDPRIEFHGSVAVQELRRTDGGWQAVDRNGRVGAEAAVAIVCNAGDAPQLLQSRSIRLRRVRGRMALIEDTTLAQLAAPITGSGVVLRAPDGSTGVGATYESVALERAGAALSEERAMQANLARLPLLLAEPHSPRVVGAFDAIRAVAPDRMPCIGPIVDERALDAQASVLRGAHLSNLPRARDLYGCFGLGSRGLAFSPVGAEIIAAQIEGEPVPVERALLDAIDPARFALRQLRHGRWGSEALAIDAAEPHVPAFDPQEFL